MRESGFAFEMDAAVTAAEAWRRVVDVSSHGDVVPLTTGSGPAPEDAVVGSRYVARTAVGPVGFDDVMLVREIDPGRRVVLEKVGRVLGGVVTVDVTPASDAAGEGGSRVAWRQSIALPWVPARLRRASDAALALAAPLVGVGYRRVVTKLLDPRR